jgi:type IV pilus assembly protein PilB
MAARLKVMSQMDISERRLPQDGRIKLKISKGPRHRLSVLTRCPRYSAKSCALRILDPSSAIAGH